MIVGKMRRVWRKKREKKKEMMARNMKEKATEQKTEKRGKKSKIENSCISSWLWKIFLLVPFEKSKEGTENKGIKDLKVDQAC
jgi:hypothetical protein